MKIYPFGAKDAPVLLLLPGNCCHWKSNFGAVIPLLADSFRVLCVSYDGFDETEPLPALAIRIPPAARTKQTVVEMLKL